jgi:hypothetical protein
VAAITCLATANCLSACCTLLLAEAPEPRLRPTSDVYLQAPKQPLVKPALTQECLNALTSSFKGAAERLRWLQNHPLKHALTKWTGEGYEQVRAVVVYSQQAC